MIDNKVVSPYYFNEPIEISIPFDRQKILDLGIDPMDLRLFYVKPSGELGAEGITDIIVDNINSLISAKVEHFSDFAIASKIAK